PAAPPAPPEAETVPSWMLGAARLAFIEIRPPCPAFPPEEASVSACTDVVTAAPDALALKFAFEPPAPPPPPAAEIAPILIEVEAVTLRLPPLPPPPPLAPNACASTLAAWTLVTVTVALVPDPPFPPA